jgi:antitoxin VapB
MDKNDTTKTATTRVFKSGNSQAVRIPVEMAFENVEGDFTITRSGDVIMIFPMKQDFKRMFEELSALPKVPVIEEHDRIELPDREWD